MGEIIPCPIPPAPRSISKTRHLRSISGIGLDEAVRYGCLALGAEARRAELPSGTTIQVRLGDRLDSGESQVGDQFDLIVSQPVVTESGEAIPEGAVIHGEVTEVVRAARPQRPGKLVLQPTSMTVNGESIPLEGTITAEGGELEGEESIREDLGEIGIGAGIGAVIGGILKGGKGALAGGGTFIATKGEQVELPVEAPLMVRLEEPISVPM